MSASDTLAVRLKKLKKEYVKGNYRRVLTDGRKIIKQHPGCVPALIAFSRAVQLLQEYEIPGDPRAIYRESRQALLNAIAIDPTSAEALNEFAYYVYTYEDSRRAIGRFDSAIRLARAQLKEAYIGKIKCLNELGRDGEKKNVFAEAAAIFGKDRELRAALIG